MLKRIFVQNIKSHCSALADQMYFFYWYKLIFVEETNPQNVGVVGGGVVGDVVGVVVGFVGGGWAWVSCKAVALQETNQALVTALINHIVGIFIIYTIYIIYILYVIYIIYIIYIINII